jgi:hypothetical protein
MIIVKIYAALVAVSFLVVLRDAVRHVYLTAQERRIANDNGRRT